MNDRGWILQEVIRRSGVTRTTFFNIQHTKSKGSYETFLKIAKAFDVDVDVILGKTAYPEVVNDIKSTNVSLPETLKSIRIGETSYIKVPVVKRVTYDRPPDTPENIIDVNFVATSYASPDDFMLKMFSDYMDPEIKVEDTVHISRNVMINSGDMVCVAFKDGSDALISYFNRKGNLNEFITADGKETIVKKDDEFILYGKVARIIHNL